MPVDPPCIFFFLLAVMRAERSYLRFFMQPVDFSFCFLPVGLAGPLRDDVCLERWAQ